MKHKTLIINGVDSTDELSADFGPLKMRIAEIYSECDRVVLIDKRGNSRVIKGSEEGASLADLQYFDIRDNISDLLLCLRKIFDTYQYVHPETKDLAHAFVGQWLYYWASHDYKRTLEIIGNREWDALAKSADSFIEKDFGMSSVIKYAADGTKIGRGSNKEAAAVPSDGGAGDEHQPDS